jgi:S-DNA-T family DNA segregation ATPase FtsK/SpoIIIE
MMAPALLITGIILLFHHGRPIYLRISCALLLPLIGSSLCHMILVAPMTSEHIIKDLWNMGLIVKSGGVLAGGLAIIFVKLFSKVASIIVFLALFIAAGMVACRISPLELLERYRNRPRYPEEPEPERPVRKKEQAQNRPAARPAVPAIRPSIDIPLDGDETPVTAEEPKEEKKAGILNGFFRQRSSEQKTPGQLLHEEELPALVQEEPIEEEIIEEEPIAYEPEIVEEPVQPVIPVSQPQEPAPAKAEPVTKAEAIEQWKSERYTAEERAEYGIAAREVREEMMAENKKMVKTVKGKKVYDDNYYAGAKLKKEFAKRMKARGFGK